MLVLQWLNCIWVVWFCPNLLYFVLFLILVVDSVFAAGKLFIVYFRFCVVFAVVTFCPLLFLAVIFCFVSLFQYLYLLFIFILFSSRFFWLVLCILYGCICSLLVVFICLCSSCVVSSDSD